MNKTRVKIIIVLCFVVSLACTISFLFAFSRDNSVADAQTIFPSAVNYIVKEKSEVQIGDNENIVVGFSDNKLVESSIIKLKNTNTNESLELSPISSDEDMALFTLNLNDTSQIGDYLITEVCNDVYGVCQAIDENSVNQCSFTVKATDNSQSIFNDINSDVYAIDENGNLCDNPKSAKGLSNIFSLDDLQVQSLYQQSLSAGQDFVVALDPGHGYGNGWSTGKSDPGANYGGLEEASLNWSIAMACKNELEQYVGVRVYITRNFDENPDLDVRVRRAAENNAQVLVSLHINSSTTPGTGVEVWVPYPGGWFSEDYIWMSDIADRVRYKFSQYFGLADRGNKWDTWDGRPDPLYPDGNMGDAFAVIFYARKICLPSMLIEHAFINGDFSILANNSNVDLMGYLDAESIAEHYGFTKDRYTAHITYGDYNINSSVDTNCTLDIESKSSLPMADTILMNEDGSLTQEWVISDPDDRGYVSLINKNSGLCLDIYGAKIYEGAKICQYNNLHADTQRWKIVYENGHCFIVSKANVNYCITVDDTTSKVGDKLKLCQYHGWGIQLFDFNGVVSPSDSEIYDGYYRIVSADNDIFSIEANDSCDMFNNLKVTSDKDTYMSHVFYLSRNDKFHTVKDNVTDRFLSMNCNGASYVGNRIVQWTNLSNKTQEWSFQKQEDGTYKIQSSCSCLFLGPYKTATVESNSLLCGCANSDLPSLKWKLIKMDDPYESVDNLAKKYDHCIEEGDYVFSCANGNNLVLDVAGFSKENFGNILLYNNCMTDNQIFSIKYDSDGYAHIKNKNSGKFIDIDSGTKIEGKNICQFSEHKEKSQKWVIVPNSDGSYKIVSSLIDNLCLSFESDNPGLCTNIVSKYDDNSKYNKFYINNVGGDVPASDPDIKDGYYRIASKTNTNKVLDVVGYSGNAGANIDTWESNDTYMNIVFKIEKDGKYNVVKSCSSDMAIQKDVITPITNGNVTQDVYKSESNQKWSIKNSGDGFFLLTECNSGLVLSIDSDIAQNGSNVICDFYTNRDNQEWLLVPVANPYEQLNKLAQSNKNIIQDGLYSICMNSDLTLCLDVAGFSRYDFGNVLLYSNLNAINQLWYVSHDSEGYVHLKNYNSSLFLDVFGSSKCRGANICQYREHNESSQKWIVLPSSDGGVEVRSGLIDNYSMSVTSLSSMSNLETDVTNHDNKQSFKFVEFKNNPAAIMSPPRTSPEQMARFYHSVNDPLGRSYPNYYSNNPSFGAPTIEDFARICYEEGIAEGVDPGIMFCQSMYETGWLQFGGSVQVEQFNFGGLGATSSTVSGASFPDIRTGIRAQIQHLKAYASDLPLNNIKVDPRFEKVIPRGCAPLITDLNGRWAYPGEGYGQKILSLMDRMYTC